MSAFAKNACHQQCVVFRLFIKWHRKYCTFFGAVAIYWSFFYFTTPCSVFFIYMLSSQNSATAFQVAFGSSWLQHPQNYLHFTQSFLSFHGMFWQSLITVKSKTTYS